MEINITTPALLFPAISLLLLAFTNRFLALASLIRHLYAKYRENNDSIIIAQIVNLKQRLTLIRTMQALGVLSLLFCVLCMTALFQNYIDAGRALFGISLVLMVLSLIVSVWEIQISSKALNIQISDLELSHRKKKR